VLDDEFYIKDMTGTNMLINVN